uniref:Uncharacterized protein n=1 Tax=Biomphalaria glabrata TaxID=6526 RepID=A0A2C9LYZ8_BIOGL
LKKGKITSQLFNGLCHYFIKEVPPYLKLNVVKEKDQESSKAVEEHSARERELISLRQKFKATESKIQEQADLITGLREELEKTKAQVLQEKENHKKILTDLETSRTQIIDVQRTERVVRVDLEQAQKRFERFRSKVFQVTFSTPGVQAPETEITDDELIEALKKFVGEQNTLHSQIKELEASVASANSGKEELLNQAEKLKEVLMESSKRLTGNGRLVSSLKQEMSIIQSVSTEQNLTWIRDLLHEMISSEMDWETRIEQALEHCGVNVKISNEEPGKHIESLMAKWESSLKESDSLKAQISAHQESHKAELELRLSALTSDMEARLQDAVEKTRLEEEFDFDSTRFDRISALMLNLRTLHICISFFLQPATTGGWVTQPITRAGSTPDLQEKDQRILQLSDEISRLKTFEFDSFRKDTLLQQYQQQIAELQNKLRQEPSIIMGGDSDLSSKLLHLETEVSAKKGEISALREQLSKLQDDRSNSPQLLRQELGERIKEISSLRGELERVKKDKNITSGLVTQMQRDMSNKDASISRMAREIEVLKKDIRERESRESQTVVKEVRLNIPPVSQRPPSWNPPLTMINSDDVYNVHTSQYSSLQTFPQISYANTPPQPTSTWAHPSMYQPPPPMPRPPLRSRPLSAGAARRNLQNVPAVGPTVGPSVPRTCMSYIILPYNVQDVTSYRK